MSERFSENKNTATSGTEKKKSRFLRLAQGIGAAVIGASTITAGVHALDRGPEAPRPEASAAAQPGEIVQPPTPEGETKASDKNIQKVEAAHEHLRAQDIFKCSVDGVRIGERVPRSTDGSGSETVPSLHFSFHQEAGPLADEFENELPVPGQPGGVELRWGMNFVGAVTGTDKNYGNLMGIRLADAPDSSPNTMVGGRLMMPTVAKTYDTDLLIPLHDKKPGTRAITFVEGFDAFVQGGTKDYFKTRKHVTQECGTATIEVDEGGNVRLVSFEKPEE